MSAESFEAYRDRLRGTLFDADLTTVAGRLAVQPFFAAALDRPGTYLENHSLGRPPDRMALDLAEFAQLWTSHLGGAWEQWWAEMHRHSARLEALTGAAPDTIVPRNNCGQALKTVLMALLRPGRPSRVLTTLGEFDSIDHILRVFARRGLVDVTWVPPGPDGLIDEATLFEAAGKLRPDLTIACAVMFQTAQRLVHLGDLASLVHGWGGTFMVDTYHAAGAMPLDLTALDTDFACGGCYKYLRGGPGAGWLYVHPRWRDDPNFFSVDTGWFAKPGVFAFKREASGQFARGMDGFLDSTPPVATWYQARAGLEITLALGPANIRRRSLEQTAHLGQRFRAAGITVVTPEALERRGNYVALHVPKAGIVREHLASQHGIHTDSRDHWLRVGPDYLTTDSELETAITAIINVLHEFA